MNDITLFIGNFMQLLKKIPFEEEILQRYYSFPKGSIERKVIKEVTRGFLSGLKGYVPEKKEKAALTFGEMGARYGWISFLKSRLKREVSINDFILKLESFLEKIE